MKSIKEIADYVYQGYGNSPERAALRENFIQGANCVIEQIEQLINFNAWSAQDLYELIDKLKK